MNRRSTRSVWRHLSNDATEALGLEVRSQLLMQLQAILAQRDANGACPLSSGEAVAIKQGHIDVLSLGELLHIAALLGCKAHVELRRPASGDVDE
jgi:hypothetical protein